MSPHTLSFVIIPRMYRRCRILVRGFILVITVTVTLCLVVIVVIVCVDNNRVCPSPPSFPRVTGGGSDNSLSYLCNMPQHWWTILAIKKSRKLIPRHMTASFAYGGQRWHWRYATIIIGRCHVWVEFGHCVVGIVCRLYVGITIDCLIFHRGNLFDLHLKIKRKHELMWSLLMQIDRKSVV